MYVMDIDEKNLSISKTLLNIKTIVPTLKSIIVYGKEFKVIFS